MTTTTTTTTTTTSKIKTAKEVLAEIATEIGPVVYEYLIEINPHLIVKVFWFDDKELFTLLSMKLKEKDRNFSFEDLEEGVEVNGWIQRKGWTNVPRKNKEIETLKGKIRDSISSTNPSDYTKKCRAIGCKENVGKEITQKDRDNCPGHSSDYDRLDKVYRESKDLHIREVVHGLMDYTRGKN